MSGALTQRFGQNPSPVTHHPRPPQIRSRRPLWPLADRLAAHNDGVAPSVKTEGQGLPALAVGARPSHEARVGLQLDGLRHRA